MRSPLPLHSLQTAMRLCFSLILVMSWAVQVAYGASQNKDEDLQKALHLRTHSLYAPYIDQDLQNRWWDFGADSYVNTNKHIRLTRPAPSQMGWLWSRLPVSVPDYVMEVEFKVSGESANLYGDGLAMWLITERVQPGPIFGSKDNFNGLGIFLDTYPNARHGHAFPRVSGMIGDGQTSYDFGNDGDSQAQGACSANFRRTNVVTKLRVTVVKGNYIDVKIQYKAWDEWTDCFRIHNVTLPQNPFIGFSAMTGDVFDAHDIIAVTTYTLTPQTKPERGKQGALQNGRPNTPSAGTSWLGLLLKAALFAGLCGGLYYAYQEYKRRTMYGGGVDFGMVKNSLGFGDSGGLGNAYENRRHF